MGVPKFFRYISERYPCLSQLVKEEQIPDFDNLYLDMNGIIHVCSHPDDFDPHFRITEEKIFGDIFHYIEVLFRMIKPQKLFFMAVDGVAPRAKMNQQRGRRFRSAKDAEVLEAKARERGEDLPAEARFDSNCITPGTVFMAKLHEQLKYFVAMKISTDYLWQRCKIILSGHNTPGEGEHKIMDYIRYMKSQPGYDPNTRHCLYGLDADLIMLGLCTHEPHFSLLREQVQFGRKAKRKVSAEQTNFYLLHLSLMREYLELEFLPLKESLSFNYDMEKIIDDWVLMGFLVGNDFIPHLPNLHITNGALPVLYNAYMKILPTLDGYINEAGILRLDRFEKFMTALASIDLEHFSEHYADLKYYQAKTGRRPNTKTRPNGSPRSAFQLQPFFDDDAPQIKSINKDLEALIKSTNDELLNPVDPESNKGDTTDCYAKDIQLPNELVESVASENKAVSGLENWLEKENVISTESSEVKVEMLVDLQEEVSEPSTSNTDKQKKTFQFVEPSETNLEDLSLNDLHEDDDDDENLSIAFTDSDSEDNLMESEFLQHKNDYYLNKLDYSKVTPEVMRDQAEGYVRAIQWNLHYYYNGVCSWSWYYPHHYAPFISDIKGFTDFNIEFELGQPFKPFEQLLAVLPSASKTLLPEPYQELMVSENSPIQQFYPLEFRTDLNGKRQEWEAVVLIPFIAEKELLKAMEPCNAKLSEEERKRNEHGPMLVYEYSSESLGEYPAPEYFPTIAYNHAKCTPLTIEDIRVPIEKLVKGPCPGAIHDVYYPGFPSFKHLKYTAYLEKAKVRVFDAPSLNDNMIVCIETDDQENVNLEKEATALIDKTIHVAWPHLVEAWVESVSSATVTYKFGTPNELQILASNSNIWHTQRHSCMSLYRERWGVDVGDTKVLVQVRTLIGHKYTYLDGGRVSLEKQWAVVPSFYPLQAIVRNLNVHADGRHVATSVQEVFPVGSKCFMLGNPNYGSQAEVIDNTSLKSGRLKLNVRVFEEPNLDELITSEPEVKYMHGSVVAQRLAISPHLLSRITGAVFVLVGENAQIHPRSSNKINIGLNLKYNKRQEEVPGYTKRVGGQWLYSTKALNVVSDYMEFCPELFAYISNNTGNDIFFESDIFPNEKEESKVQKIAEWLKQQPFSSVERRKTGSECIEQDDVRKLEQFLDEFIKKGPYSKQVIMQVKPRLLYKPDAQTSQMLPDRTVTFKLYDRVVNVRDGHTVPFGLKGVVVAINYDKKELGTVSDNMNETDDQMFDVIFDQPFAGGLNIHTNSKREYRMPPYSLINISHGERLISEKAPNSAATNAWFNKKQPVGTPANNGLGVAQGSAFTSVQGTGTRPAVVAHSAPLQTALAEFNVIFSGLQKKNDSKAPPQQPITMDNKSNDNTVSKSNDSIIDKSDFAIATKSNDTKKNKSSINKSNDTTSKKTNIATPTTIITKSNNTKSDTTSKQPQPPIVVQPESYDMTECLKKMLNIGEKAEEKKSAPPVTTKSISVQDMFHAARFKEEKVIGAAVAGGVVPPLPHTPYTVQVLNYWQTHGLGVPRYTYIEHPDHGVVARAVLANGNVLVSSPCLTRELAAEDVAHMILTKFVPWWEQQSSAEKAAANQRYKQPTTVPPGGAVHPTAPPLSKVVGGVPPPPPQHTPYTVQVLNYWQAFGLGVPKYVYMEAYDHHVVARVELPTGELILSRISPTREQAAEDVARRIINEYIPNSCLVGSMPARHMMYPGQGPSAAAPGGGAMGFPTPPKQWREPQKNIEKTVASHHKPLPPKASSHHPSAPPPPHRTPAAPSSTNKKKGAGNDAKVVPPNEKKKGASTSVSAPPPFVPLQAVKKQRSKSGSTTGNTENHRKAAETKTKNAKDSPTAKARQNDTSSKKPATSTLAPGTPTKQRKPRKCRIAANFSALQSS